MNIQHSSVTDMWFTPDWLIKMCKKVLWEIDLDPASCHEANERIGAKRFIDQSQDALRTPWFPMGAAFLNPPGGKAGNKSKSAMFWRKLIDSRSIDNSFKHAIFIGFSLEQLATTQDGLGPSIANFPFCIPSSRIRFDAAGEAKTAPSHSNVIAYVPGRLDRTESFRVVFEDIGVVVLPSSTYGMAPLRSNARREPVRPP